MAGKIFFRERETFSKSSTNPKYQLIGLLGVDIKIQHHPLAMSELKFMAEAAGAELVKLPPVKEHEEEFVDV